MLTFAANCNAYYKMESKIQHEGIVQAVYSDKIVVRIEQLSACSGCHAKQACTVADKKDKLIEVFENSGKFSINEKVLVEGKTSSGLLAVLYAFVIPLVLLFCVLFSAKNRLSEIQLVWISLGTIVLYYTGIFIFRNKVKKRFVFQIKKANKG